MPRSYVPLDAKGDKKDLIGHILALIPSTANYQESVSGTDFQTKSQPLEMTTKNKKEKKNTGQEIIHRAAWCTSFININ